MTTIYLTQWQYQQVLDGQISTHLDVLDNNKDGFITTDLDAYMPIGYQNFNTYNATAETFTDVWDQDNDAAVDILNIGLESENGSPFSVCCDADIEAEGELYSYNLEALNKVIDYYNNGGSWNDDDFEKHVYEGIGATGQKAPESKIKAAEELQWKYIAKQDVAVGSADADQVYATDEEQQGMFVAELLAAGATDLKYNGYGDLVSYTINGSTYNMSTDFIIDNILGNAMGIEVSDEDRQLFSERSSNDSRTQELLATVGEMGDRVNLTEAELNTIMGKISTATTEKAELEAEKELAEEEAAEQEEKVAATKKEIETQQKEVEEQTQEYKEVAFDLDDINAALEDEIELEKASAVKDSSTSKKASLSSKVSDLTSKLSSISQNIKFTNFNIDATQSVLNSETKVLDNINTDISEIDTQIATKDVTINDLQAQLDAKVAEKASLE